MENKNLDELWEVFDSSDEREKTPFEIKDIDVANWAINKINEENNRYEFYKQSVNAEIARLKETLENEGKKSKDRNSFFLIKLDEFIKNSKAPVKKTKTKESLKFANGTFVRKLPKIEIKSMTNKKINDDKGLIEYCKEKLPEYIKMSEEVKWGDLKKELNLKLAEKDISVDIINTETGELDSYIIPMGSIYSDKTKEIFDTLKAEETMMEMVIEG